MQKTSAADKLKAAEAAKNKTYTIEVEGLSCKLRKLDRATYKIVHAIIYGSTVSAASGGGGKSVLDAGQIILNTCWLEGDEALKDDRSEDNMEVNFAACQAAIGLVEFKEASLKKN